MELTCLNVILRQVCTHVEVPKLHHLPKLTEEMRKGSCTLSVCNSWLYRSRPFQCPHLAAPIWHFPGLGCNFSIMVAKLKWSRSILKYFEQKLQDFIGLWIKLIKNVLLWQLHYQESSHPIRSRVWLRRMFASLKLRGSFNGHLRSCSHHEWNESTLM